MIVDILRNAIHKEGNHSFSFGVAFYHEFVVDYIVVQVWRRLLLRLLLLLLLLVLSAIIAFFIFFLLFFLAEVRDFLHADDSAQAHSDLLAVLMSLGNAFFHCDFFTIELLERLPLKGVDLVHTFLQDIIN